MDFRTPPPFPGENRALAEELNRHVPFVPDWDFSQEPAEGEADFRRGLFLRMEYPDPEGLLQTAETDFNRFLREAGLLKQDASAVVTAKADGLDGEAFRTTVLQNEIRIEAGNTEGIRRGLYELEDRLAGSRSLILPPGVSTRTPWLKNRISRSCFAPVKRPPFHRDELMDERDYYPEEYLNTLAREGVNGLWITVVFREICTTDFFPADPFAERRLAKLRGIAEKCRRYGIRIWAFCVEPSKWHDLQNPCPADAPELKGPEGYSGFSFCPNSETAQKYLYECTNSLFAAVPRLGGLITISRGEGLTSCLSTLSVFEERETPCGSGCGLGVGEILEKTLRPMADGIHAAAPEAGLISWIYLPYAEQAASWIYKLPEKLGRDVILAFNFESGCTETQLGKIRTGGDYWLSRSRPGDRFARMASAVQGHCSLCAKIQACSSHEIATAPFIPVPGLLYRKYREMRRLGVEHVMLCWFFGGSPGLMNKAAGRLAYEDFLSGEDEFLRTLAERDWKRQAREMAEVWKGFSDAYANYPLDTRFQYYGPMHDGPVWPLHLKQVMRPLPRTWRPDGEPAGDMLGDALSGHTLAEAAVLTRRLSDAWHKARHLFSGFRNDCQANGECVRDGLVMDALDLLFRSGANILEFYLLRNALADSPEGAPDRLKRLKAIAEEEAENSIRLAELCRKDPRMGYHPEAEVYKFFPEKLFWRAQLLKHTLATDFRECEEKIAGGVPPPEVLFRKFLVYGPGTQVHHRSIGWKAERDHHLLRFLLECVSGTPRSAEDHLRLRLTDRKGEKPPWILDAFRQGMHSDTLSCADFSIEEHGTSWHAVLELPLAAVGDSEVCFNIRREWKDAEGSVRTECFPEEENHDLQGDGPPAESYALLSWKDHADG